MRNLIVALSLGGTLLFGSAAVPVLGPQVARAAVPCPPGTDVDGNGVPDRIDAVVARLEARGAALAERHPAQAGEIAARIDAVIERLTDRFSCD
jgi:hypothetical protein